MDDLAGRLAAIGKPVCFTQVMLHTKALLATLVLLLGIAPQRNPSQVADRRAVDSPEVNRLPVRRALSKPRIRIRKSRRQLYLFDGPRLVRNFPVALGPNPVGDKKVSGDGRTPEGDFYICMVNPRSRFHLSLGLSYPDAYDAARGLRERLITRRQHDRIVRAIAQRRAPPWDTRLGGEIFIHGEGAEGDWTLGCIALDNDDMEELFRLVGRGVPVTIDP